MAGFFTAAIYQPIYNALALLIGLVPGGDVGIAIVLITLLVRFVLFPLSLSAIKTQIAMRRIDPELKALREEHKNDKEALGRKTMELFRKNKINPLAGFFLILIQLPIIIGLYAVLRTEAHQLSFDPTMLYSFVHAPAHASLLFLGSVDLTGKSIILAILAGIFQYMYAKLLAPSTPPPAPAAGEKGSLQQDFSRTMQLQMQYVFPVVLGAIAYFASAAIALYFVTSNAFSVLQELVVQRIHGKR
ncbi:MAG: membrane protein insertase YidC [Patescibacteria group bacterium]|nr:membrane protein insertase YidC [Patescibacteria group bacterium]